MPNARHSDALRIATYNVEWFNHLFDDAGMLLADNENSARYGITRAEQIAALGMVFAALDADGIMIIEAPDSGSKRSSTRALENFARHFGLRTNRAITGFASETEQEISFLFDPGRISARHAPLGAPPAPDMTSPQVPVDTPRFDGVFWHDLNTDAHPEQIRFSKPPLELEVTASNRRLRLIGVHAKSKAPHGARNEAEVIRISIENRRKQLAQCLWLRQRIEGHLDAGDSLLVMGDFNDGPGLDEYEKLFGHSGVEIVLGNEESPERRLTDPHASMILARRVGAMPTSSRFYIKAQKRYFGAMLDFIMVSHDLAATAPQWRIWHPLDDPACWANPELREALLAASDHFPVSIDLFGGNDDAGKPT